MGRRHRTHAQKTARRARNAQAFIDAIAQSRCVRELPTHPVPVSFVARGGTRLDLVFLPGAVPFDPKGEPPVDELRKREQEALLEFAQNAKGDA